MNRGKIYRVEANQFVTDVNYKIIQHPPSENWWGELTLVDNVKISDGDLFVIELEDGHKSKCHLRKLVNRVVTGIPARYTYHITGLEPLE